MKIKIFFIDIINVVLVLNKNCLVNLIYRWVNFIVNLNVVYSFNLK